MGESARAARVSGAIAAGTSPVQALRDAGVRYIAAELRSGLDVDVGCGARLQVWSWWMIQTCSSSTSAVWDRAPRAVGQPPRLADFAADRCRVDHTGCRAPSAPEVTGGSANLSPMMTSAAAIGATITGVVLALVAVDRRRFRSHPVGQLGREERAGRQLRRTLIRGASPQIRHETGTRLGAGLIVSWGKWSQAGWWTQPSRSVGGTGSAPACGLEQGALPAVDGLVPVELRHPGRDLGTHASTQVVVQEE